MKTRVHIDGDFVGLLEGQPEWSECPGGMYISQITVSESPYPPDFCLMFEAGRFNSSIRFDCGHGAHVTATSRVTGTRWLGNLLQIDLEPGNPEDLRENATQWYYCSICKKEGKTCAMNRPPKGVMPGEPLRCRGCSVVDRCGLWRNGLEGCDFFCLRPVHLMPDAEFETAKNSEQRD